MNKPPSTSARGMFIKRYTFLEIYVYWSLRLLINYRFVLVKTWVKQESNSAPWVLKISVELSYKGSRLSMFMMTSGGNKRDMRYLHNIARGYSRGNQI